MNKDDKDVKEKSTQLLLETSQTSLSEEEKDMFDSKCDPPTTAQMVGLFCKLTIPAISTNIMDSLTEIVSAIYAGQIYDPVKLAAVGLANVCFTILFKSVMLGLNSA